MNYQTILQQAVAGSSQAEVARQLGYSPATVSQVLAGNYPGRTERIATRIVEVYGEKYGCATVDCPVLGVISVARCISESKKEFSTANPQSVELWDTCPDCQHRR